MCLVQACKDCPRSGSLKWMIAFNGMWAMFAALQLGFWIDLLKMRGMLIRAVSWGVVFGAVHWRVPAALVPPPPRRQLRFSPGRSKRGCAAKFIIAVRSPCGPGGARVEPRSGNSKASHILQRDNGPWPKARRVTCALALDRTGVPKKRRPSSF